MRPLHRHLAFLFVLPALTGLAYAQERSLAPAAAEFEWRFTMKGDQTASSNIATQNICRGPHRFQIVTQDMPAFLHLLGEPGFQVAPRSQHMVPVQFDSRGLSPGLHEGKVVIQCLTCRAERGCSQDFQRLHIYMLVEAQAATPLFLPGRVLVTIPFDSEEGAQATAAKLGSTYSMKVEEVSQLNSLKLALIVYSLPEGADVLKKITELESHGIAAQPDFLYSALEMTTQAAEPPVQAMNPPAQLQYGPRLIRADRLPATVTGKGVKVALVDTAVDAAHPALQGKITAQTDVTGKGFTADVHGTLLAGIIGGSGKSGIVGVAPEAEILSIKACHPLAPQAVAAQCWSRTLANGLDFAIEKKAAIINMSLGGPSGVEDKLLKRMVDEAVRRGMVVVAAAGNDGPQGKPGIPAALPKVLAVTAVDSKEQLYAVATQGDFVDLAAPGVEILSTSPGGKFLVSSGTSLAAAFVTGTAALALEQQPGLAPGALQAVLEKTAKDLGPPGKDPQFGYGLVNACAAIAELKHDSKLCQ